MMNAPQQRVGLANGIADATPGDETSRRWGITRGPWLWGPRVRILFVIDGRVNCSKELTNFGLGLVLDALRDDSFAWWVHFEIESKTPPRFRRVRSRCQRGQTFCSADGGKLADYRVPLSSRAWGGHMSEPTEVPTRGVEAQKLARRRARQAILESMLTTAGVERDAFEALHQESEAESEARIAQQMADADAQSAAMRGIVRSEIEHWRYTVEHLTTLAPTAAPIQRVLLDTAADVTATTGLSLIPRRLRRPITRPNFSTFLH